MKLYYYNDLIDKNIIPDDCEILICRNNNIIELPVLPDGLTTLFCRNNNIIELPVLPDGLIKLYCYNNNIIELPELPSGLIILYCYNNPIKYITPNNYKIMKNIYLTDKGNININDTIFYYNSGCSSNAEFFGCEE